MKTLLDKELIFKDPPYQKKILLFDLETSPRVTYTWDFYEQDVLEVKEEWYILCFAYKWLGEKTTHIVALPDFPGYSKNKSNDEKLTKKLWELFNSAEILIGQNLDKFDVKKSNARFIFHGLDPISKPTIDTLKLARKHFSFGNNKLDYLGQYLSVGRKIPHTGKHLWLGCMNGNEKDWELMKRYCKQDVELLEKVYLKLRGWDTSLGHNLNLVYQKNNCPKCQSEHYVKDGFRPTLSGVYQKYRCMNCGNGFKGDKVSKFKPTLR